MTNAIIFPGQGSQSIGMLAELAQEFSVVEKTFADASEVLGYDLWKLVQNGPEQDLNATDKTQPAMLTAGVAVWRVLKEKEAANAQVLAGHSLGEYTALVCAEAIAFADAIKLVEDRGLYMQSAVPAGKGAMAAVLGLEDAAVIKVCEDAAQGEVVEAVNFNSPGQVVVAGDVNAVNRAVELASKAGAKKAIVLPVSVPSHCALMKPAADKLKERLAGITVSTPKIPVIHNVDVASHSDPEAIRNALVQQLYQPVRWVQSIEKMIADGATNFIECGPGKVLAGLNKRIARQVPVAAIVDVASLEKALAE